MTIHNLREVNSFEVRLRLTLEDRADPKTPLTHEDAVGLVADIVRKAAGDDFTRIKSARIQEPGGDWTPVIQED